MRVPPRPSSTHTAAAGVQQPALLGEERRDLLEQLPAARRLLPRLIGGGLGQVEREAVHHPPGGVVELDRRGQAAGRQRGLRPDVEGRVDGDRAAGRRHRRGDEIRHALHAIDLHERLAQVELEVAPLVDDLRRPVRLRWSPADRARPVRPAPGRAPATAAASAAKRTSSRAGCVPRRSTARAQSAAAAIASSTASAAAIGPTVAPDGCQITAPATRPGDERHQAPAPAARAAPDRPEQRRRGDDHQHGAGRRRVQHHRAHGRRQPAGRQRRQRKVVGLERRHRQRVRDQHVVVRDRGADAHADQRVQRVAPRRAAPAPLRPARRASRQRATVVHASQTSAAASSVVARKRISSCSRQPRRVEAPVDADPGGDQRHRGQRGHRQIRGQRARQSPASRRAGRSRASGRWPPAAHSSAATRPHQRARASSISAGATRAVPRIVPSGRDELDRRGIGRHAGARPEHHRRQRRVDFHRRHRLARAGRGRQRGFGDDHADAAAGRRRSRRSARAGPAAGRAASARGTSPSHRPGVTPAATPDAPPTPAARRRRRRW